MAFRRRTSLWLRVSPYYAYHATVVAVLVGSAAWYSRSGQVGWPELFLTLIGAAAVHTAAAFFNEYYDFAQGADAHVGHKNPYAGGSRVLYLGSGLRPNSLLAASLIFAGFGALVGVYLASQKGFPVLILGLLGYTFMFFYTASPLRLAYRGLGEFAVGLSFGPLVVMGSYYVQARAFAVGPFAASILLGLFIALVLLFNEFPDYAGDLRAGKRNLVVRLTPRRAVRLCGGLFVTAYALLFAFVSTGALPLSSLLALATVPLSAYSFRILRVRCTDPDGLRPANAAMLLNHLVLGIALVVGYVLPQ